MRGKTKQKNHEILENAMVSHPIPSHPNIDARNTHSFFSLLMNIEEADGRRVAYDQ
jgi:hypothetical protein